jgi:hypothetical protein
LIKKLGSTFCQIDEELLNDKALNKKRQKQSKAIAKKVAKENRDPEEVEDPRATAGEKDGDALLEAEPQRRQRSNPFLLMLMGLKTFSWRVVSLVSICIFRCNCLSFIRAWPQNSFNMCGNLNLSSLSGFLSVQLMFKLLLSNSSVYPSSIPLSFLVWVTVTIFCVTNESTKP